MQLKHLTIDRIERPSADDEEADVTLSSEQSTVVAFCHPCAYVAGQLVPNLLRPSGVTELRAPYLEDWPADEKIRLSAERLEQYGQYGQFGYRGCGRVVDRTAGLVRVFGFVLDFGDLPAADVVEFQFDRLDLW
ncbi:MULTISPECIES: hypothetical protein [unclassified Variovorax]|uniref:hypothetical protein n=1 Tax=unclassified Variovorax TaxID=663243 RepID=UPI000B89739E|nr:MULTISPECIES: hypothetical protein [unclassified Variovorax]